MPSNVDPLEEKALREHGILGRGGEPNGNHLYGNQLYAFEYELLPPEAKQVLELVAHGGPLLYPEHDGKPYGNRSKDLPGAAIYREFTVPTPVSDSQGLAKLIRGRRRLVIRENGLVFFTACHYERVPGKYGSDKHESHIAAVDERWRNGFYVVTGIAADMRMRIAVGIQQVRNAHLADR